MRRMFIKSRILSRKRAVGGIAPRKNGQQSSSSQIQYYNNVFDILVYVQAMT